MLTRHAADGLGRFNEFIATRVSEIKVKNNVLKEWY
jgi:hypothetical protein